MCFVNHKDCHYYRPTTVITRNDFKFQPEVTKKEDGLEKPGLVEVSQTIKSLDELCPRRTKATKKEWISRYTSLERVIRRNGSVEIQGLERDQSKYKPWKGSDEKTGLGRAKA